MDIILLINHVLNVMQDIIQLEIKINVVLVQQVHIHHLLEQVVVQNVQQELIKDQPVKLYVRHVQVDIIQQEEHLLVKHVLEVVMVIV